MESSSIYERNNERDAVPKPPSPIEEEPGNLEWENLRLLSLRPGGFGEERTKLWPKLLGVDHIPVSSTPGSGAGSHDGNMSTSELHPDENQIKLDTDRSFVMYPIDVLDERDSLKDGLHELLVSLFRRRPKLSYFQGYHDIASVIFLTLPPELHLACLEKMSIYRVRDCMVSNLDPVVGLLRVTTNLLRLADPEYANILKECSPLPFFALSNLMTLFSHDMPTLSLIQHVFDYLLCRPPVAVVYLTVAIILSRKAEVLRLQGDGDEGMIHSLLNGLPDIIDETPSPDVLPRSSSTSTLATATQAPPPIPEEPKEIDSSTFSTSSANDDREMAVPSRTNNLNTSAMDSSSLPSDGRVLPGLKRSRQMGHLSRSPSRSKSPGRPPSRVTSRSSTLSRHGSQSDMVSSLPHLAGLPSSAHDDAEPSATTIPSVPETGELDRRRQGSKPRITLSQLLRQADEMFLQYPIDHPELRLNSIMGPQSVIFTWKETRGLSGEEDAVDVDGEDCDAEAEAMVLHPELIVYPYLPEHDAADDGKEEGSLPPDGGVDQKGKRRRRKLYKTRRLDTRTKTIVAGAIVVLGVAMAVYGIRSQRGGLATSGSHLLPQAQKRWTQGRQWLGSAFVGATMKVAQELGLGGDAGGGRGEL